MERKTTALAGNIDHEEYNQQHDNLQTLQRQAASPFTQAVLIVYRKTSSIGVHEK